MNEERINDMFGRLRELPSDVSFSEVEHWARLHAAGQLMPHSPQAGAPGGGSWFHFKPPLYMTSIITAAAASGLAALIAISTTDETPTPQPVAQTITDSALRTAVDTPAVQVKVERAPSGDTAFRQITIVAPTNARVTVSSSDASGTSQTVIVEDGSQSSFTTSFSEQEALAEMEPMEPMEPMASVAAAEEEGNTCVCNNNSAEVHDAFEKQLLQDGLIKSATAYSFLLSRKAFTVNGKRQSAEVHKQYLLLYMRLNGGQSGNFTYAVEVND